MSWNKSGKTSISVTKRQTPKEKLECIFDLVCDNSIPNNNYKPQVRFSKFPVCPILFTQELLENKVSKEHFSMTFYTKIGHVVHSAFQTHAPLTKQIQQYVFGNWKCLNCDKRYKLCVTPKDLICDQCNKPAVEYEEVEVNYKGVKGHIDLILLVDGEYFIVDFKTTSQNNVDNPSQNLPKSKHLMQIECYVFALMYQFDIEISHYALIYVSRDTTNLENSFFKKNYRWVYCRSTNIEMLKRREKQLDYAVQVKRLAKKFMLDHSFKNLKLINDNRPCFSKDDYNDPHTGMTYAFETGKCPYLASCCKQTSKLTQGAKDIKELVESVEQ